MKNILNGIIYFYKQIYYRLYELYSKNPIQADRLASGILTFVFISNIASIIEILMITNVIKKENYLNILIIPFFLGLVIFLLTHNLFRNFVKENEYKLKKQNNLTKNIWRFVCFIYTSLSFYLFYLLDTYIRQCH